MKRFGFFLALLLLLFCSPACLAEVPILQFDDCESFDLVYAKSENLTAVGASEEEKVNFDGDFSFIQRTALSAEWLVYKINPVDALQVSTYFWDGDALSHFKFYVSADGEAFEQVKPKAKIQPKQEGKWLVIDYTLKNLPPDAAYVKIEFDNLNGNSWNPAIRSVRSGAVPDTSPLHDIVETPYESPVRLLSALKIISGFEDGTFRPDLPVTRAEFTASAVNLLGMGAAAALETGYTYFQDVPFDQWYTPFINYAIRSGLASGGDTFEPEAPVSKQQAEKILITALGYQPYAEQKGGFPDGYVLTAAELKLSAPVEITRGEMALLFFKALETDLMRQVRYGGETTFDIQRGKTLLSENHHTAVYSGQLMDNGITRLTGLSGIASGQVEIAGHIFDSSIPEISRYLGHTLKVYVQEQETDTVIYFIDKTKELMQLSYDQIHSVTQNEIMYMENEKTRSLSIPGSARVIYNGEFFSKVADCDLTQFDNLDGVIEIIGATPEILRITAYDTLVLQSDSILNRSLFDKYFGKYSLDINRSGLALSITRDGESLSPSGLILKTDEIIQVAQSKNGRQIDLKLISDVVFGAVEAIGADTITLSGRIYPLSDYYLRYATLRLGERGEFYLDRSGKLVWGDIQYSPYDNYAYVTEAGYSKGMDSLLQLKALTMNGKLEVLNVWKNANVSAEDIPVPTLIRYRQDKDGQIRQIQIPSDYTENGPLGEFALYFSATLPCRSADGIKTFGSLYSISPDTQVFVIPDDPADEHGFRLRNTSFLGADKYYHIALYQVDQDYNTAVAVVYENGSELTGFSNYLPVSVVERVTLMQNEQEDTVFCLQTITDGNRSQVPISVGDIIDYTGIPGYTPKAFAPEKQGADIVPGELLQYSTNEKGEIDAVRFLFTSDQLRLQERQKGFFEWVAWDGGEITKSSFFSETAAFFGRVAVKYNDRIIAVAQKGWSRMLSTTGAAIYLLENGKVKISSLQDLSPGDMVACGILSGRTSTILIVK